MSRELKVKGSFALSTATSADELRGLIDSLRAENADDPKSALISLSGGLDSLVLLAFLATAGYKIRCVGFNYGSKHGIYERNAAREIANKYNLRYTTIRIMEAFTDLEIRSSLMRGDDPIPEGHYESETMKQTVVPGRNSIFIAMLTGMAESIGAKEVFLGIHAGDHLIYPDCRPKYFEAMSFAMAEASDGKVRIKAPFLNLKKKDIIELGLSLGAPFEMSRTCYKYQDISCGKCASCQERLAAFHELGIEDPLRYDSRELLPKNPGGL